MGIVEKTFNKSKVGFIAMATTIVWTGLGLQLYIFLSRALGHKLGILQGLSYYLSYFTNLSNLLAGLTLVNMLILELFDLDLLKLKAKQITAVAVFICMASIVFNLELRKLVPGGWIWYISNVLLHDLSPIFFLVIWWFYTPYGQLRARDALIWLIFPVLYFLYILVRGDIIGHYPYPFFNIVKFGYQSVMLNALGILLGFVVLGLLFVKLDSLKIKKNHMQTSSASI